jgi:predicted nucleotidyltransferase
MSSITQKLNDSGLINPPSFLASNLHYEVMMGSVAYGVSSDVSDLDAYGFCIPSKEILFPHLAGYIEGFGKNKRVFENYVQHGIIREDKQQTVDLCIYNITKYFQLCMENNPNMIDSLFVPQNCILHITSVGNLVRENRKKFLHKGCWHKFKGYAYSQLHKMSSKNPIGKRKEIVEKYGFDVKFAYHVIRLLSQVEQILEHGDLDLQEKGRREHMKAIRNGEVSEKDIRDWASDKEKYLENLYSNSKLPYGPNEDDIRGILLNCLESHYGSLSNCLVQQDKYSRVFYKIKGLIDSVSND